LLDEFADVVISGLLDMTPARAYSMEKQYVNGFDPCPLLPVPTGAMSYRDLQTRQTAGDQAAEKLFISACTYANYLWISGKPARAILALCRAIYLNPEELPDNLRQPYDAYVWFLNNHDGLGFLGNPRVSFCHQAVRMPAGHVLKRHHAWAMWYLSITANPALSPDPEIDEQPPAQDLLYSLLNEKGLANEGTLWMEAMKAAAV
jgi:hypothetical protein